MHKLLIFIALFHLSSCGKKLEDNKEERQNEELESFDGLFKASLAPVPQSSAPAISGEAKVEKFGDDLRVKIWVKNAGSGVHRQALHLGSCEAPGKGLIPLDGDLSSQLSGSTTSPRGSSYRYSESTSYYLMLSDLHLSDEDPSDAWDKFPERELSFNGRAVMIYDHKGAIACGTLARVSEIQVPSESWVEALGPESSTGPAPDPGYVPVSPGSPEVSEQVPPRRWWDRVKERWRRFTHWIGGRRENIT